MSMPNDIIEEMTEEASERFAASRALRAERIASLRARCGWLLGASEIECGKTATRGTTTTGPLCDEHGEEYDREEGDTKDESDRDY